MVRPYVENDKEEVLALQAEYYVYLPNIDWNNPDVRFKNVYVDSTGKIIGFTCINMIPELIMVHDQSIAPNDKYKMFTDFLSINREWAFGHLYKQLYAFLDTDGWIRHLKSVGFKLWEKGIYYLDLR